MDSWYGFLRRMHFISFKSIYGCLSVYRCIVSPHFHNCCLSQLSLPTFKFTTTCVNLCNRVVYRGIKIFRSNYRGKLCFTTAVLFAPKLGNQATNCFHFITIQHQYTNFCSYLDFHKMCNGARFSLSGSHMAGSKQDVSV